MLPFFRITALTHATAFFWRFTKDTFVSHYLASVQQMRFTLAKSVQLIAPLHKNQCHVPAMRSTTWSVLEIAGNGVSRRKWEALRNESVH